MVFLLSKEAALVLKKYKPGIIAITGTVGKTSTKEAVYTALTRFMFVRKSPKNFNSEFGVPFAILGVGKTPSHLWEWPKILMQGLDIILLPNHYPDWLVLEVGTDQPGDIKALTRWLKPDLVIVTQLAKVPVHVEAFSSAEALFEEKGNLVKALKVDGTLILNSEDEDVLAYKNLTKEKVVLFGNGIGSDFRADHYQINYDEGGFPAGISFEVKVVGDDKLGPEEVIPVALQNTLGESHISHVLAALAVCAVLKESLPMAAKTFAQAVPIQGRLRLIEGVKQTLIIDDTYNSSPLAQSEALGTLKTIKKKRGKRKIAILGDMLELGRFSINAHREAGRQAAKVADILVTVGVRSRLVAEGAQDNGLSESCIFQFDEAREAGRFVQELMKPGDIILAKGSQGVRMERVVEEIMARPEDKEALLVRQDAIWQERP